MTRSAMLLIIPILAISSKSIANGASQDLEAKALMNQVVATYQSLSTYRDSGRSVQTLKFDPSEKNPSTTVINFTTAFKRPDQFKFSWTRTEDYGEGLYTSKRHAIWSNGDRVWRFATGDKAPVVEESFSMAVAGVSGGTQGTALHIFRLLTDQIGGFRFDQLRGLKIVRSETLSGVDCYVIHGSQYGEVDYDLWIGKQDLLIRKGINLQPDGNTTTFERTDIVVNQRVPDSEFLDPGYKTGSDTNGTDLSPSY